MLPFVVPSAPPGIALTVIQLAGVAQILADVKGGPGDTPYGRFFKPNEHVGIPSRLGMTFIYAPALLVTIIRLYMSMFQNHTAKEIGNERTQVVIMMLVLHFAKRLVETWYVHVYSGDMDRHASIFIGIYYAVMTWMVLHQQFNISNSFYTGGVLAFTIGLYVIGEFGNLYHHILLANMRNARNESASSAPYVIPRGGLFDYVVSPHYFFEVIAWIAIACAVGHANAHILAISMGCYLASRASKTKDWYMEKFKDFPQDRWCMIPGIF